MENKDLKYLKKFYGENFSHLCRELFPTLLEKEGLLSGIISKKFAPTRSLYDAIKGFPDNFKSYIYSFVNVEKFDLPLLVDKTPEQLLDEAGYILYPECKTEKEIQSFKKYYAPDEELCTFRGNRLNYCRVWFAVKKNVDEIKRENFPKPTRQDEYGTSVISIQFTKADESTLSIKNRYNHRVNQPDATFGNNLDNIIDGLTNSFLETYNIKLLDAKNNLELKNFVQGDDGKFYRYTFEEDNIYFCENNIIIDNGNVKHFDKSKYLVIENYIFDLEKKKVVNNYLTDKKDEDEKQTDGFIKSIGEIEKLEILNDKDGNRTIFIKNKTNHKIEIKINDKNEIIGYRNPFATELKDNFLNLNRALRELYIPNVKTIRNECLYYNEGLKELDLPNAISVGDLFCQYNKIIEKLNCPKLQEVGNCFLAYNNTLTEAYFPKLKHADGSFFYANQVMKKLDCPNLVKAESCFCEGNEEMTEFNAPKLKKAGFSFFYNNNKFTSLSFPKLESTAENFLHSCKTLKSLSVPKLKNLHNSNLYNNIALTELYAPELISIGNFCLSLNEDMVKVYLPKATNIGDNFMLKNKIIKQEDVYAPKVVCMGDNVFNGSPLVRGKLLLQNRDEEHE